MSRGVAPSMAGESTGTRLLRSARTATRLFRLAAMANRRRPAMSVAEIAEILPSSTVKASFSWKLTAHIQGEKPCASFSLGSAPESSNCRIRVRSRFKTATERGGMPGPAAIGGFCAAANKQPNENIAMMTNPDLRPRIIGLQWEQQTFVNAGIHREKYQRIAKARPESGRVNLVRRLGRWQAIRVRFLMERWQAIEDAYHAARDLSDEDRSRFLDARCGSDRAMRQQIDVLLAQDKNQKVASNEKPEELLLRGDVLYTSDWSSNGIVYEMGGIAGDMLFLSLSV